MFSPPSASRIAQRAAGLSRRSCEQRWASCRQIYWMLVVRWWLFHKPIPRWIKSLACENPKTPPKFLPLPEGEGRGEGERSYHLQKISISSTTSPTAPCPAPDESCSARFYKSPQSAQTRSPRPPAQTPATPPTQSQN